MKQTALKDSAEILHKIGVIEKEVLNLKLSVIKKLTPSAKNIVSLRGIIKGVDISEEDIIQAKKSFYSSVLFPISRHYTVNHQIIIPD